MPAKNRKGKTSILSPHASKRVVITPERIRSVTSYVESLAADHMPEGRAYTVTTNNLVVLFSYAEGVRSLPWLPKTYKGVTILRKILVKE